jgi:hypothetical protein
LPCFCNGLPVECRSSSMDYIKFNPGFNQNGNEWSISDKYTRIRERVDVKNNGIEFKRFNEFPNQELYFIASEKFKGNKVY